MKTAIVILNWNTRDYLEQFLPILIENTSKADIIIADNASSDDSLVFLKQHYPNIRTIALDKNYGFTGGYNKALAELRNENYEYYLLLNSDIEVSQNFLEPLEEHLDNHPDCAVCAPKLLSWYEKDKFEYAGAAGGLIDKYGYPFCRGRILKSLEKDEGQYNDICDVFWVSGACLLIRAHLYWEMSGLDERFFAHMEEIDLCWRLQLLGYKISVIPQAKVWHLGGGTLPNNSPWKLQLNFRNNLLMLSNNLSKSYALQYPYKKAYDKAKRTIFFRQILDGLSALVYILSGKFSYAKAVYNAHKEYRVLRKSPNIDEVRQYAEKYSSKSKIKGWFKDSILFNYLIYRDKIFKKIDLLAKK